MDSQLSLSPSEDQMIQQLFDLFKKQVIILFHLLEEQTENAISDSLAQQFSAKIKNSERDLCWRYELFFHYYQQLSQAQQEKYRYFFHQWERWKEKLLYLLAEKTKIFQKQQDSFHFPQNLHQYPSSIYDRKNQAIDFSIQA